MATCISASGPPGRRDSTQRERAASKAAAAGRLNRSDRGGLVGVLPRRKPSAQASGAPLSRPNWAVAVWLLAPVSMASTARERMAARGWRTPLGLRGSGTEARTSNKLNGADMASPPGRPGDLPRLPSASLPSNITVRTALPLARIRPRLALLAGRAVGKTSRRTHDHSAGGSPMFRRLALGMALSLVPGPLTAQGTLSRTTTQTQFAPRPAPAAAP